MSDEPSVIVNHLRFLCSDTPEFRGFITSRLHNFDCSRIGDAVVKGSAYVSDKCNRSLTTVVPSNRDPSTASPEYILRRKSASDLEVDQTAKSEGYLAKI